jgi:hypothetical protein
VHQYDRLWFGGEILTSLTIVYGLTPTTETGHKLSSTSKSWHPESGHEQMVREPAQPLTCRPVCLAGVGGVRERIIDPVGPEFMAPPARNPLAEASLAESLTIASDLMDPVVTVWALERFAELAVPKRAPKRAATIWGAAARLREKIGIPIPLNEEADSTRAVATTRVALGDDAFDKAWNEGRAMTLDYAVRYALGAFVIRFD